MAFIPGTRILDLGTGGGFPGLPLAILFPECDLHLVDARGKKIRVVQEVAQELKQDNVRASHVRGEEMTYVETHPIREMFPHAYFADKYVVYAQGEGQG